MNFRYRWALILGVWTPVTHWGRETHICVGKLTIIASDNGLSPGRHQAIIWTNAVILLIGLLGTKFNEILLEIHTFSFTKMHLKMSSAKWRPFYLGLNVLKSSGLISSYPICIYFHIKFIICLVAVAAWKKYNIFTWVIRNTQKTVFDFFLCAIWPSRIYVFKKDYV